LPLGFHPLSLAEVEAMCVTNFPLSASRQPIMDGLKAFVGRLISEAVQGDLWLDGSFLTEKIDPEDVDIVLRMQADLYDYGTPEYRDAVDWVISNRKATLKCDSYILFQYYLGHPLYDEGEWWYSYWHMKWGFSREEDPKGSAVIKLPGVAP
jgi:Family of unknown function (DUF6932)